MLPRNLAKIEEFFEPLRLDNEKYLEVVKRMNAGMDDGLGRTTNAAADIKMYITYVRSVPDGSESGNYLALDLGGTNFRVLLIHLHGGKEVEMSSTIYMIPENVMHGSGTQLFDHIAGCLHSFIVEGGLEGTELPLGFTFSFPCKQEGLAKARLVTWTKGFKCEGVEGEDIVELLHQAIVRKGLKVRCVAVINDTVGALMSCAHEDRNCRIGFILGTGTNACYMEDISKVELWDGDSDPPRQVIINTEMGAFGNSGSLDFITTQYDRDVDSISINPGKQLYEKMISGMYMGEIARKVILALVEDGCLFDGRSSEKLRTPMRFYTKYISEIESDEEFDNFVKTRQVLEELDITRYRLADCMVIQEACRVVSTRAAHLAACGIAVLLNRIARPTVTIGMDGSLYRYHPKFNELITEKVQELAPNREFKLMLSHDGSGKGAALVAAVSWRLLTTGATH